MEIDDKLKNRLAGTAVVTVLAVIFLPMLFESPPEKKAQVVSELNIPHKPEVSPLLTTAIVPDKPAAVVAPSKPAATNSGETAATAVKKPEKTEAETEVTTPAQDSETAAQEEENPAPATKKAHKKKVEEHEVAVKKPAKTELPVLAEDDVPKKEAAKSLPSLDSAPAIADKHRWVVQVASLTDQTKANAFRDKLRSQGFPATVDSAWIKGKGRVYRLKVGPELDAEKAKSMKNKINQMNNVNSIAIAE